MPNCAKTHQTNTNTANVYHEEYNEYKENQWNNAIGCTLISYLNSWVKIMSNSEKIPAIFKWCYCHFVLLRFSFLFSVHSASDCKHASTPGPRKDQETVMWTMSWFLTTICDTDITTQHLISYFSTEHFTNCFCL